MAEDKEKLPFIDPNSGAVPQPGGFAVVQAGGPVSGKSSSRSESQDSGDSGDSGSEEYDPSNDNIDDVLKHVEKNPDQRDAVIKAEEAGKNRSTLLSKLKGDDEES